MHRAFLPLLPALTALVFAASAATADLRTRRIPNRLVLLSFAAAVLTQFVAAGWKGVAGATAAAMLALAITSLAYLSGGVGAGDVKLLSAMAAFAGMPALALLLVSTALAGGLFGLLIVSRNVCATRLLLRSHLYPDPQPRPLTLPYGLPIGCGVLAVFCHALWSSV